MIIKKFTAAYDADRDILGWVLNTMPHFDPATGMGVAHDCLEHLTRRVGFEGEMEAFGVSLWIRGGGGYWQGRTKHNSEWHQNIAFELVEFLAQAGCVCAEPPRADMLDEHEEDQLSRAKAYAVRLWDTEEVAEQYDQHDVTTGQLSSLLDRCLGWIRRGFLTAERKYSLPQYDACYLFQQIEQEVNALHDIQEGDTLSVRFSRDNTDYAVTYKPQYNY